MNLLAIDTSTECATVAIAVNDKVYTAQQANLRQHAQCILPMIDDLLVEAGLTIDQLQGIVYGCGPGSFTGLRITCSVAKGLAYAHDLALYPVCSLQAIANEVFYRERNLATDVGVLVLLDARMQQVYWCYFENSNRVNLLDPSRIQVSSAADISICSPSQFLLAGVGLSTYSPQLPQELQDRVLKQQEVFPNAQAMIRLVHTGAIKAVSAAEALPLYVRNQVTHGGSHG